MGMKVRSRTPTTHSKRTLRTTTRTSESPNEVRIYQSLTLRWLVSNVFLGLAFEKQNRPEDSEKSYRAATLLKGNDPLAWQGLISLYEQQGARKLDEYHDAASQLAAIFVAMYVECAITLLG